MIGSEIVTHIITPLAVAVSIGLLLGIERELSHKPAGLRTQVLITVGTALFVLSGKSIGDAEAGRVAANVITGLGFLGAGVILQHRGTVRGLTTASLIWVNGALGVAAALGHYRLAGAGVIAAVLVLRLLGALERRLGRRCQTTEYEIVARESPALIGAVEEALHGAHVQEGPLSLHRENGRISLRFAFCDPPARHRLFTDTLRRMEELVTLRTE